MEILIIFLAFAVAAFLSSMSGGGASVITFPILLSMGVSLPLTAATSKLSAVSSGYLLPPTTI